MRCAVRLCHPATGGCLGILNYEVNLQRLGNAISLWLGIQPPDLFFYAVRGACPLRMLHAACRACCPLRPLLRSEHAGMHQAHWTAAGR